MILALVVTLVLIGLCLAMEAFFSGSEISFISANRARIFRQAKEGDAKSVLVKSLLSKPEILFGTTVVGTTVSITLATALATLFIIRTFGYNYEWLNLIFLSPLILVFGEFVPKMVGRTRSDQAVLRLAPPLKIASVVLYPVTRLLSLYARILKRIVGGGTDKSFFISREELRAALPASRGSDVTAAERQLIEKIFDFRKLTAGEMLRPLIEVIAIEENRPISEAIALFSESGHSRLPVYQERIDRIVGVLTGFDCLRSGASEARVSTVMTPAFFVPDSKVVGELLGELRTRPMAIAVNEFGGAEGIITMEDVMEEIVGEIEDEYDEPPRMYHQLNENSYLVNARMEVDDLRDLLRIPIPADEDYQTLAGFLLKRMQKIPKKWDSIVIHGTEFVVQSATDRSIEEVCVILHHRKSR